jgi:hypothetical protein
VTKTVRICTPNLTQFSINFSPASLSGAPTDESIFYRVCLSRNLEGCQLLPQIRSRSQLKQQTDQIRKIFEKNLKWPVPIEATTHTRQSKKFNEQFHYEDDFMKVSSSSILILFLMIVHLLSKIILLVLDRPAILSSQQIHI